MVPRQIPEHGSESPRRRPPREPRGLPAAPFGDGEEERGVVGVAAARDRLAARVAQAGGDAGAWASR